MPPVRSGVTEAAGGDHRPSRVAEPHYLVPANQPADPEFYKGRREWDGRRSRGGKALLSKSVAGVLRDTVSLLESVLREGPIKGARRLLEWVVLGQRTLPLCPLIKTIGRNGKHIRWKRPTWSLALEVVRIYGRISPLVGALICTAQKHVQLAIQ